MSHDTNSGTSMGRRSALGLIGAGGLAMVGVACAGAEPAAVAPAVTMPSGNPGTVPPPASDAAGIAGVQLFADDGFNYDALTVLGSSAYGLAEVGEVITMVNSINAAGPSNQTYTDTFVAWGDQLAVRAGEASASGNVVGAAQASLRAANYYESALFFVLGTTEAANEAQVYAKFRATWEAAVPSLAPVAQSVSIPYVDGPDMPAWFFAPDRSGRKRPTLIVNNGSDGQATFVWGYGGAAAIDRGWNVLLFEGPGQGSMLFDYKLPFRDDWERVITPVVDYLQARPDVDDDAIALIGLSMGGELVCRAAAFEQRLAAVVAGPGVTQPWEAFPADLRAIVTSDKATTNATWTQDVVPNLTAEQQYLLAKRLEPYGAACIDAARQGTLPTDFWTPVQTIVGQDIIDLAGRITAPTLVIDYDGEQFYPGQAEQLYGLLTAPKDYVKMTVAEGAQLHCSPMAPQVHNNVVFSWLEATVTP
jgi:hypothetical protein